MDYRPVDYVEETEEWFPVPRQKAPEAFVTPEEFLNSPVTNVSHSDALAFCSWAGLRLPSAEEWRWAAIGHRTVAEEHDCRPSDWRLVPARPAGASWCGAQDMFGNVYEITNDGLAWGGSYRTDMNRGLLNTGPIAEGREDVGFRIALSAR